ncbi:hypothetical protein AciM339_0395 [Aciduliprofundum sp. MAR08-339]|uniref:RNA-binding domain-containing protein n=1 Tax=Aciduliprofundum sp. (strain MAR08-339) TaxID=673860 RepID=UPI0002A4B6EB|nr:hypothetical protein AciM339_0395 [Aciduliprofundum sp. MAR08-339]
MGLEIVIEAELHPTEDVEKVKNAILNIFPDARLEILAGEIRGISHSVDTLGKILKEMRIRDAARSVFLSNLYDDEIVFSISKQAATVGKVNFSVGNVPLGDIKIIMRGENLREIVDMIAPDTRKLS